MKHTDTGARAECIELHILYIEGSTQQEIVLARVSQSFMFTVGSKNTKSQYQSNCVNHFLTKLVDVCGSKNS